MRDENENGRGAGQAQRPLDQIVSAGHTNKIPDQPPANKGAPSAISVGLRVAVWLTRTDARRDRLNRAQIAAIWRAERREAILQTQLLAVRVLAAEYPGDGLAPALISIIGAATDDRQRVGCTLAAESLGSLLGRQRSRTRQTLSRLTELELIVTERALIDGMWSWTRYLSVPPWIVGGVSLGVLLATADRPASPEGDRPGIPDVRRFRTVRDERVAPSGHSGPMTPIDPLETLSPSEPEDSSPTRVCAREARRAEGGGKGPRQSGRGRTAVERQARRDLADLLGGDARARGLVGALPDRVHHGEGGLLRMPGVTSDG